MQIRYRWYRIQVPHEANKLVDTMTRSQLTQDTSYGFLKVQSDIDGQKFRFLWRMKLIVTRFDEEGRPFYEDVASICFTDFAIISKGEDMFLRVENPGRSNRDLFNALESIVGLGFTAKPITFDKVIPTTIFENVDASKLVGLKVIGAVVEEDLIARMEFVSKQGMNISNMSLLNELKYKVESAVHEVSYEGLRGQVSISSNGMVKVSGQLAPMIVNLIEQDISAVDRS